MNLQKQPNKWSCLLAAFAIALDIPIVQLIDELGHDGSEIIWPDHEEPLNRRSFSIHEMFYLSYEAGYSVMLFNKVWDSRPTYSAQPLMKNPPNGFFNESLLKNKGVLVGRINGQRHAVAYQDSMCFDPNGTIYAIDKFNIETFFALFQRQ